jgi:hypothetical protein
MPQIPDNDNKFLINVLLYCIGTIAGLGAKLAVMHKKNPITMKDIMVNSAIAFAAAFLVYFLLDYFGHQQAAIVSSVICGRFADDILTVLWKSFKKYFKDLSNEIE